MQIIDIPTLKNVVKEIVIGLDEPVMIEGESGAGKSEGIAQAVEEAGALLCDIRLGQYDSVDMRGFPGVNKATGLTTWYAPSTMPFIGNDAFPDDKDIVVFFDEITSATPPVAANCYQLINDWRLGEHVFKPRVKIICAGNRTKDKGVVNRMPAPLANRMTWFEVKTSVKAWCDYAQSIGVPPIFYAFMQYRKNLLHTWNDAEPAKVFATPRTWMKCVKYYQSKMSEELKRGAMEGAVGEGPAMEFWGFHDVWHKVLPIKVILADPLKVPVPDEESMKYATAVSVSGAMNAKNTSALYSFLKRMAPEYVILAWQLALARDKDMYDHDEFLDFSKRYRVVFS